MTEQNSGTSRLCGYDAPKKVLHESRALFRLENCLESRTYFRGNFFKKQLSFFSGKIRKLLSDTCFFRVLCV